MDKVWFEILINALGLIGIIAGILALQCNKHIQVLAFKMAEEGIFGVQYILLGGITGGLLNIVGVLRNLLFAYLGKKDNQKMLKISRIGFAILLAGIGFLSWDGYISLLVIFAKVLSTIAYGTTNVKKMRLMLCVTITCWICYGIYVGSVTSILNDSANLLSVLVAIFRYDILPSIRKNK
ncbi:MAG: YgjV family protein [Ruminococcaceae bacterium]|nr:YgjV family protein [Oscillospiraceae bacterium]